MQILGALAMMPYNEAAEKGVLQGLLKNGPTAYLNALMFISKKLRSMYLHAYQSYLWNKAASRRVAVLDT